MPEIWEKVILRGNLCYHAVDVRIRHQEQKLWGFYPGEEVPKTIFEQG